MNRSSPGGIVAVGGPMAVGSVILGGGLFGTAGTAQALGPSATTPLAVGTARLLVGALLLLAAISFQRRSPVAAVRLWRSRAGLIAGISTGVYQVCFFASVQQTGVALGTLVTVGSAPILAGLLAWAVLAHHPTRAWTIATTVCLVGLILLADQGLALGRPIGIALALIAGLATATFNVAARQMMDRGVPMLDILAGTFLLGAIVLLPFLLAQPLGWVLSVDGALLALYLGVATMALANTFMAYGLKRLTPGPVTTLMLTDPLTATVLGVIVLRETLAAPAVAGLLLVLLGLLLQGFTAAYHRTRNDRVAAAMM
jgi:DME family drug/metabolite transporter